MEAEGVLEDFLWYRQDKFWDGLDTWGKRNVMRTCMSLRAETQGSGDDQPS